MPLICKTCGHVGDPTTVTKGHFVLEVALWLAMLLPGLIYSIWRLTSRHQACAMCGSAELIPLDSPVAQQLLAQLPAAPALAPAAPSADPKPADGRRVVVGYKSYKPSGGGGQQAGS